MKIVVRLFLGLVLGLLSCAVAWIAWRGIARWRFERPPTVASKIDRHPPPRTWPVRPLSQLPRADPAARNPYRVDLRARDLSGLDLAERLSDLREAVFDTATRWPAPERLPAGFDAARILELGRNPGLGVRALHAQGITGEGVGIVVIDQVLPTQHPEYADRLRWYEEADDLWWPSPGADMHGAAVASLAVGRTVGVAPEADLYYIATHDGMHTPGGLWRAWRNPPQSHASQDFGVLARCVRRVLAINRQLPPGRKIRAVVMAIGWVPGMHGYEDIVAAANEARAAGLFVVCSSIDSVHGFKFQGLGREPLADPDDFGSYGPGRFWARAFPQTTEAFRDRLLVPMDSRTTAGFTAGADYAFSRQGGWSWAIPYLAGAYALAAQVKPALTPDEFWATALKTGRTIEVEHDGRRIPFGPILDPAALIAALRRPQ